MAYEGGIGVYKKPQNRKKNDLKPQNRTKTRPKPKTAYKTIKTNKIVISGAFKAKYSCTYLIKVFVNIMDLSETFVFLSYTVEPRYYISNSQGERKISFEIAGVRNSR